MLATLGQLVIKADADATDQDVLRQLDLALIRADKWVKSYCKQELEAKDFTEYHDGGTTKIVLYQARASTITGTSVDDDELDYGVWWDNTRVWGADTEMEANTDFRLLRQGDTGIIHWLTGSGECCWEGDYGWWNSCRNIPEIIRVIYRAGFEEDEIPDDLNGAVLDVALQMYLRDSLSLQTISSSQQAASAVGTVQKIRRGQSEITYSVASSSSSTTTGVGSRNALASGDPYGVNNVLQLYKDWRR